MTLSAIKLETASNPTVSIIWMHGLGADGNDFVPIVKELDLSGCPGIRFVFPNAPQIPVTVNGGYVMPAWYDIRSADLANREDETGLRSSQAAIEELIGIETAAGAQKIILAGFSQGSAMTLQTGLRHSDKLAGLMCLSGYLPLHQTVAQEASPANKNVPIFMAHGNADPVVPIQRALQSRDLLKQMGYQIEWHEYEMQHSVCIEEIVDIGCWLRKVLRQD
ncbi:phospholipase/carboxylesterase [Oxalobacteraceae bacterium GrIS 2.11]